MKHFELLEDRHHVVHYKEEVPPKEVVDKALWEAWKTSPSKLNQTSCATRRCSG